MGFTRYPQTNYLSYMGTSDVVNLALLLDEDTQIKLEEIDRIEECGDCYDGCYDSTIDDDEFEAVEDYIDNIDDDGNPTDYLDNEVDDYIDSEYVDFGSEIDIVLGLDAE